MTDPADWNDKDWRKHDAALARISGPKADAFARALDLCGWMIVPQPGFDPGRWPMDQSHDCPAWAEPMFPPEPPKRPSLQLIECGKCADGKGHAE